MAQRAATAQRVKNYTWSAVVLREVFDHGGEDELGYPADDALVIEHLFTRLRQFLDQPAPARPAATVPPGQSRDRT
jgi:hypothetical protein